MLNYAKQVFGSWELFVNLTQRQLKGQYKRAFFGQLWSLANPLALMIIYTFVFSFIFKISPGEGNPSGLNSFPLWLLSGLLPWLFFARGLSNGTMSLVANHGLIQKVYFNRFVLPASEVAAQFYNWCFEMGVLIIALLIAGAQLWFTFPFLLLGMALLFIFTLGVALMLSILNVYFRDTEYFVSLGLQIWIYVSPVVYPVSLVETESSRIGGILGTNIQVIDLYFLNPIASFMVLFRQTLYDVTPPRMDVLLACAVWAGIVAIAGIALYSKKDRFIAEVL